MSANKISYSNVLVDIGTSEDYINTETLKPVTKVYYVVTVDGVINYASNLPNLDSNAVCYYFFNLKYF